MLLGLLSGAGLWGQRCAPAPSGLAVWYTFEEPMFAQAKRIEGLVGKGLRFENKQDFFEVPRTPKLLVGEGDFSVELWVRTESNDGIRNMVDFRNEQPRGWALYIRKGQAGFQVSDGADIVDAVAATSNIADGKWHHVVGVVKRLPQQPPVVFVDGQLAGRAQKNAPLSNLDHETPMWIARHHRNRLIQRDTPYFPGDFDELTVYRRALRPEEIQGLYRAGKAGKCKK